MQGSNNRHEEGGDYHVNRAAVMTKRGKGGAMRMGVFLWMMLVLPVSSALALDVTMNATVDDNRLIVTGMTNLPDGTELLVTLTDADGVYKGRDRVIVSKGAFATGPIPQPLNRECTLNILTQIATYQPANVRSIIGDCGDMLTGRLVVKGSVGGLIVSYHDRIVLSKQAVMQRKRAVVAPKMVAQRKAPAFNRYSSYCALKASGRKDLPPVTESLVLR